ncbi:MAG TPA: plastocyanin/azurin family copper-binding protein [Mycobacteriales bacterium]|nr:plastocyanin/azurin family copper-binding protein [Mycobacteriales bacterium]
MKLRLASLAVALAAAATACGGSSGGSHVAPPAAAGAGGQHVTIDGNSMFRFSPMSIAVHTGTVTITLTDQGAYPHNIDIPSLKVTSGSVSGNPGGTSTSFTVTFPHAGTYPFKCDYHSSAGMVGDFVVS